jgi:hypothetical protein
MWRRRWPWPSGRCCPSARATTSVQRACSAVASSGAATVAEVGGVLGTLTYPHLILPYSVYTYWPHSNAIWGSLVLPYTMLVQYGEVTSTYLWKSGRFKCSQCAHYGKSPYKAAPIQYFKTVRGLPACANDPPIQVLDNVPRHGN